MSKLIKDIFDEYEHGYVIDKWDFYLDVYEDILYPYKDKNVSLLEIGIQNGGSINLWSNYFANYQHIIGCDINQKCTKLKYEKKNIDVVVGDVLADETYQKITQLSKEFDIIIDDGSHSSSDIIKSFLKYFSHLKEGGVYIIEDVHCSYWQQFEGGLNYPYSAVSFFKKLIDAINYQYWLNGFEISDIFKNIGLKYQVDIIGEIFFQIRNIEFFDSIIKINKNGKGNNRVLNRRIKGNVAYAFEEVFEFERSIKSVDYEQYDNYWSTQSSSPEELLVTLKEKLDLREKECDEKASYIEHLNRLIKQIKDSKRYRISCLVADSKNSFWKLFKLPYQILKILLEKNVES